MKTYQLTGIGNAVVDVISQADDSFLELMGIEKGIMQLIEQERGEVLYASMEGTGADAGRVGCQHHCGCRAHWGWMPRLSGACMTTRWAGSMRMQ